MKLMTVKTISLFILFTLATIDVSVAADCGGSIGAVGRGSNFALCGSEDSLETIIFKYEVQTEDKLNGLTLKSGTFMSGFAARDIVSRQKKNQFLEKVQSIFNLRRGQVFPLVYFEAEKPVVIGSVVEFGTQYWTTLHSVVNEDAKDLFVYDAKQARPALKVQGFSLLPIGRGGITLENDLVLLSVEGRGSNQFLPNYLVVQDNFNYLDISYPQMTSSVLMPTSFASRTSHVAPDISNVALILNRVGQDHNSSGGAIFDIETSTLVGFDLCITGANSVVAMNFSKNIHTLYSVFERSKNQGFLPSLKGMNLEISYSSKCDPVGGRRTGP